MYEAQARARLERSGFRAFRFLRHMRAPPPETLKQLSNTPIQTRRSHDHTVSFPMCDTARSMEPESLLHGPRCFEFGSCSHDCAISTIWASVGGRLSAAATLAPRHRCRYRLPGCPSTQLPFPSHSDRPAAATRGRHAHTSGRESRRAARAAERRGRLAGRREGGARGEGGGRCRAPRGSS